MDSKLTTPPPSNQSDVSPESAPLNLVSRRHLLRAAAVTAPLVATLPSGAAMANASSFQCAVVDQNKLPTAAINPQDDTFVRVQGKTWTETIAGTGEVTFYNFTSLDGQDNVTVDADGNRYPTPAPLPQTATDIYLLVLYQPVGGDAINGLHVDDSEPPLPSQCTVKSNLSGWTQAPDGSTGTYCVYPVADLGAGGSMGITGSCLASFTAA